MIGKATPRIVLVALLLAANAALASHLYRQLRQGPDLLPVAMPAEPMIEVPRPQPVVAFDMPSEDRYAAIVQRPVFSSSRRPLPGMDVPHRSTSHELHATLTGIAHSQARRIALMRAKGSGEMISLVEGQLYDGWTLTEVESDYAIFQSGEREAVLELIFDAERYLKPGKDDKLSEP